MFSSVGQAIDTAVRAVALAAFVGALFLGVTQWAIRRRSGAAPAWWSRAVRRVSDPILLPVEHRVALAGGNPQDAPLWLLGGVLVAGLLAITGVRWLRNTVALLHSIQDAGPRAWFELAVIFATSLLSLAIIARVIASWLGAGRYNRWMRPAYFLTDWIIEPIRRRLPPFGTLDLSPFLAYVLVLVVRSILLSAW